MNIIDGNALSLEIRKEIANDVSEFIIINNIQPKLAILTVGDDPASQIYVNKKIAACKEVGILAEQIKIPIDVNPVVLSSRLRTEIERLNNISSIHAYILQLPLPKNLNPLNYFDLFNPLKDVDVFHPENVGLLVQGRPRFRPCTPHGIQLMLNKSGIKVAGKNVVVINRSNVVGKPLSSMLIQECDDYANATVTVCHDHTPPNLLKNLCLNADIIIVAVGKSGFLTADIVKNGATVIDVGINRVNGKIVGDADFDKIMELDGNISPVPGGVGPMTVCMLLKNTLEAAKLHLKSTLQPEKAVVELLGQVQ